MIIRHYWRDDDSVSGKLNDSDFYSVDETIKEVQENFLFRCNYSAEGEDIYINDSSKPIRVLIQSSTNPLTEKEDTKKVHLPIDTKINRGDYITYDNVKWLVMTNVVSTKAYKTTRINMCNCTLRWQNKNGDIVIRQGCTEGQSTSGAKDTQYSEVLNASQKIYIPYDEETVLLSRGDRFVIEDDAMLQLLIDNGKPIPVFEVQRANRIDMTFNGKGVVILNVEETAYDPSIDNVEDLISGKKDNPPEVVNYIVRCEYDGEILEYDDKFIEGLDSYFKYYDDTVTCSWRVESDVSSDFEIEVIGGIVRFYCPYVGKGYGKEVKIICDDGADEHVMVLKFGSIVG